MDKYNTKAFFVLALKKELDNLGHGGQAKIARCAGVSRSLLNDIVKGRSFGGEAKRLAIAAALGYDDYETFLDIGRALMKVAVVRQAPTPARKAAMSDELIELLQENRKLRLEIDALKTELGKVSGIGRPA
jgi:transcriptional regulator with XRE-family HTH domain